MKFLISLLFIFLSFLAQAQIPGAKAADARPWIWNHLVKAIEDFDQDEIFQLTNFPLEGDWYEDKGKTTAELEALYKKSLSYLFPEELRAKLKVKDYTTLVAHPYKNRVAYSIIYYDELMESTTLIDIAEVQGVWKIVALTIK